MLHTLWGLHSVVSDTGLTVEKVDSILISFVPFKVLYVVHIFVCVSLWNAEPDGSHRQNLPVPWILTHN